MDALAAGRYYCSKGAFSLLFSNTSVKSVPPIFSSSRDSSRFLHRPRRWWKPSCGGLTVQMQNKSIPTRVPSSPIPNPPLEEAGEDAFVGSGLLQAADGYNKSKTAHVRLYLERACEFGQSFLLAGDDPMFGLWDPSNALPLEWSDGHFWIAELDIPVGKSIRFKFILRDSSGEITWQPGPDRILSLWETPNTIVVAQDWENADSQEITEVQETAISTDFLIGSNGTTVASEIHMDVFGQGSMKDEMLQQVMNEEDLAGYTADPVLIPGLTPAAAAASVFQKQVVDGNMEDLAPASSSYEADNCNSLQLSDEQEEPIATSDDKVQKEPLMKAKDPHVGSKGMLMSYSEEKLHSEDNNSQSTGGAVLENDIQWGRKMLHQLLLGLGFKLNLLL